MAAASIIDIKNASVIFADTQAALTTGTPVDYKCQVNNAAINAVPKLQTVPATFCNAETQVPSATGWALALTFMQDWGALPNSLSQYLFANDAQLKWFLIKPVDVSLAAVPGAQGQCWIVAGAYLGAAGVPVNATSTMPLAAKPTLVPAVLATGATAGTPGTFTPAGAVAPANLAAMVGITASPTSAWTTGQSVVLADGSNANWTSSAWAAGIHA